MIKWAKKVWFNRTKNKVIRLESKVDYLARRVHTGVEEISRDRGRIEELERSMTQLDALMRKHL